MSVEGYKEGQFWPGSEARHPVTVVMETPRVIAYDSHLVGTYPVHFDPVWWCEGFPAGLNVSRQLMILRNNIGYCVTRFGMCPALWAGAGMLPGGCRICNICGVWRNFGLSGCPRWPRWVRTASFTP